MSIFRLRKVAFIGTGIMGAPICEHILDAGFDLTVYNRTKAKAEPLIAKGAHWAESAAEAAAGADLVLTMLGYPNDVEDVYLGRAGILEAAPKGAYLVDLTTSDPTLARELHDAAEVMDKHAFDCPVTGGEQGAKAGTLTLILGATEAEAEPVMKVLTCFSDKVFYFDKPGAGQVAKLCNQVSLASCMVGYADAMALAEQSGIDVERMLDMVGSGMGGSVAMERLAPVSLAGDYKPRFLVEHLRKDLGLALGRAHDMELMLPGAETAFEMYDTLCEVGGARMGTQAITLLYEDEAACAAAGLDWSLLPTPEDEHEHEHEHHHHHHH